jgi:hypothetical protein
MLLSARSIGHSAQFEGSGEVNVHVFERTGHTRKAHMCHILQLQTAHWACMALANKSRNISLEPRPMEMLLRKSQRLTDPSMAQAIVVSADKRPTVLHWGDR